MRGSLSLPWILVFLEAMLAAALIISSRFNVICRDCAGGQLISEFLGLRVFWLSRVWDCAFAVLPSAFGFAHGSAPQAGFHLVLDV